MKITQGKGKRGEKSIIPLMIENARIKEMSQEFFPGQAIQEGEDWTCPICLRPHYKEPGPFSYGATIHEKKDFITLWVQSVGCCRWEQEFSIKKLKERQVKASNLMWFLKKHFYSK